MINKNTYTVYRKDFNEKPSYSIGIFKRDDNEQFDSAFFPVKFKGMPDIKDKTKIKINNSFFSFYKYKDQNDIEKKTIFLMIMDFEILEEEQSKEEKSNVVVQEQQADPFEEFGKEVELEDDGLPF